ncbi:hypothetical protein PF005_g13325 [Phytophthora fragariae]|uniref:Uncharacterized protein n=2 Tax=Phytophthora fragariae TaxID=53985 RepID=A0A6A3XYR6_9STRA|nr:hypothetical protein PF003_g28777 [Phytophthora fragariae]KAE9137633.1 hypothetical protein PF006_g14133 [Phytophthora fragariae]KAE9205642.1 hypothetical protein PF005_g13325 [Phytophthora fragariae]KAE9228983.1 hypothetical protein PF004_g10908 [Phytophthora fragariae]
MTQDEAIAFNEWLAEQDDLKKRSLEDSTVSLDTRISKKGPQDETDAFNKWLVQRGFDPSDVEDESKKRSLEDSAVSLDTRVSKKGADRTEMIQKEKVAYLFKNVYGLDRTKIRPYIKFQGEVNKAKTLYLGKHMKFHDVDSDEEIIDDTKLQKINKQMDWGATLNYVLGEISTGVRALNLEVGKETDAKEQKLKYLRIKHTFDALKVVDPKHASRDGNLLKFEQKSYKTPTLRGKKTSKSISPSKKDYVFEPPAGKGLIGRGLRRGGKSRAYNLADIEGSGKASDLKYKRLGSKFIRKADLNNNRLKLVFPNRTGVGPIRAMSDELTEMVKDLVYNDNISQQAYRALSIADQRLFYEIVKKTHVQHTLLTPMQDPRLTLRAEFDKLWGEIALGNDNQDMLRELSSLATDMFEQKTISSSEFRTIMSAHV